VPEFKDLLLYERHDVLDGQVWRLLTALLVQIDVEGFVDSPLFALPDDTPFRVLPSAHVVGVAAAVMAVARMSATERGFFSGG